MHLLTSTNNDGNTLFLENIKYKNNIDIFSSIEYTIFIHMIYRWNVLVSGEQKYIYMNHIDIEEKLLTDYNDVFADIVNVLLFHGEQQVNEHELINVKDRSRYKAEDGQPHEQERDLSKVWEQSGGRLFCAGAYDGGL